ASTISSVCSLDYDLCYNSCNALVSRWIRWVRRAAPSPMDSYNHLETLSVSTSNSLPKTLAATADGPRPTTDASPWWCSQISLTADIAEVFPVPAGPMTADKPASEVNTAWHAWILSSLRG